MATTRSIAQAREALHAAFTAFYIAAGEDVTAVGFDNLPQDIKGRDEFVKFQMLHVSGQLAALGLTCYRRRVQAVAAVWVREGTGRARSDELAELCIEFFETLRLEGFSLVAGPQMLDVAISNGYLQVNVSATYDYETSRT